MFAVKTELQEKKTEGSSLIGTSGTTEDESVSFCYRVFLGCPLLNDTLKEK